MRLGKIVAVVTAGVFIFNLLAVSFLPLAPVYASPPQELSLGEAVFYAVQNSDEIRQVKIERVKQIEKREAQEAIKITRRREKYPWFSLLLNVNLPQQHGLPKEIQLIMKILRLILLLLL